MKILCVFGQHNYGNPERGESYEYANFVPSLRQLGHEVVFFESWNRACYSGFEDLNRMLLQTVEREQPEVIFSVLLHYEVWLETWQILRNGGIAATVNWATDDSWKYAQFSRLVAPSFHAFTTTYRSAYQRYQADGLGRVLLTQWAANEAGLQPPLPAGACRYPVSFVGTAHGGRRAWIEALRQQGLEVACFGYGWPQGPVAAEEIPRIIRQSAISLNFANSPARWRIGPLRQANQIKARTFEVPGAGGFLLTEWADHLDLYYTPGQEIEVFQGPETLADKIRYYLAYPGERDAIARAGFERTRREHTYQQRLSRILDFTLQQREAYFSRLDTSPTGEIDWGGFEQAVRRHGLPHYLRVLRRSLVKACTTIWGPTRGPRAARRLVFELSWRLAGDFTYSSAGWPGRMFYRES